MSLANALRALSPRDAVLGNFSNLGANVAAKQTATLNIAPSRDYLDLRINLDGDMTVAMIQEIRLKARNKTIQVWDGPNLSLINDFDKVPTANPGSVPLVLFQRRVGIIGGSNLFSREGGGVFLSGSGKDLGDESSLNCGSPDATGKSIDQLSIEIDVVNSGATPTLSASASWYPSTAGGAGSVRRIEKKSPTIQVGRNILTRQDFLLGDVEHLKLNRLIFVPPAGAALTNFLVRYQGTDYWVRSNAENTFAQQFNGWRVSQTANGMWVLDFSERGYGDEFLDIASVGTDLQVEFDSAQPGLCVMFQDSIGLI